MTEEQVILSSPVEDVFDTGFLVIVPDVPDDSAGEDTAKWNNTCPRERKLCLIDHSTKHNEVL